MAGSPDGVRKGWAKKLGIPVEDYLARVDAGEKWCGGCKAWHPRSAFGKDQSRRDGLAARCLDSRVTSGGGRPGARERRLRAAVGERWCRGCAAWLPMAEVRSGVCRKHAAAEARAFYAKNPGPIRSRKTARARGLAPIPDWWRAEKFEEYGGLCAYGCGRRATALDHVWPVSRSGPSAPTNLVPVCTWCNSSKKASDPQPWIDRGFAAFPYQWFDLIALNYELSGPLEELEEVA